jgi:hypothetical protein
MPASTDADQIAREHPLEDFTTREGRSIEEFRAEGSESRSVTGHYVPELFSRASSFARDAEERMHSGASPEDAIASELDERRVARTDIIWAAVLTVLADYWLYGPQLAIAYRSR